MNSAKYKQELTERIGKVIKTILNQNDTIQYENKKYILDILNEAALNGDNKEIKMKHIDDIHDMIGRNRIFDWIEGVRCFLRQHDKGEKV